MMARMDHFAKSPLVTVLMSDFTEASVDAWLDWRLEQPGLGKIFAISEPSRT
jgi:hypothetical protein